MIRRNYSFDIYIPYPFGIPGGRVNRRRVSGSIRFTVQIRRIEKGDGGERVDAARSEELRQLQREIKDLKGRDQVVQYL